MFLNTFNVSKFDGMYGNLKPIFGYWNVMKFSELFGENYLMSNVLKNQFFKCYKSNNNT